MKFGYLAASMLLVVAASAGAAPQTNVAEYLPSGEMKLPANYREWVFLTSSVDLNYDEPIPGASMFSHSMLDNVFVNPEAYRVFLQSGTWPDNTIMVKENRVAASAGSISKSGKYQAEVMSMELHVKDARLPGQWAFFVSDGKAPSKQMPRNASCFACHEGHGAVDTTFVQFYPTLLQVAKTKGTLSAGYLKDEKK